MDTIPGGEVGATADVPDGVTGHTGPPVPSLEEREGPLAAWMSRARYFVH